MVERLIFGAQDLGHIGLGLRVWRYGALLKRAAYSQGKATKAARV